MHSKFLKALLVITICSLALGLAPARVALAAGPWYVRPDGDDVACDGLTDAAASAAPACAFATITTAITSASDGDVIHVASGTYLEEVNLNKPGLQLLGAGYATTTIMGRKDAGGANTLTLGANNLLVDGFTITRDGNTAADWAANVKNQGVIFNQGTTGSTLQNNLVTGNRNAVYLNNTQDQTVRSNIITNNRTGIQLVNNVTGLEVSENEITNNWTMGILFNFNNALFTTSVEIRNNNISGNWYGEVQNRWSNSNGVMDLSGNWFGSRVITTSTANSTEPGYAVQIPVAFGGDATPPAGPVPMIGGVQSAMVDYSPWLNTSLDTDTAKMGFQGDFSFLNVSVLSPLSGLDNHIQDGINLAAEGGTVSVWDGTYYGGFTIDRPLTLQSEHGAAVTILHGGVSNPAIYVASIRASDVTLDGFTVTNPAYMLPGADVAGIVAAYYGDPLIENVRIINNVVTEIGSPSRVLTGADWNATGIVSSGAVDGLEIANNTITNMHHINTGAGNTISPVAIGVFGEDEIKNTRNINVHDNLIYDISAYNTNGAAGGGIGIALGWASGAGSIRENTVHDVSGRGISTSTSTYGEVEITGNTLYNIQETAILFRSLLGGSITGNNIVDNTTGITLANTIVTAPSIHHNRILHNDTGLTNQSATVAVSAENNWWGCNEGPTDLSCDDTTGTVDAAPWLVLSANAAPSSIPPFSGSTVTFDLLKNSDDVEVPTLVFVPDGIAASYLAPNGGSLNPLSGQSLDGVFTPTVFTAPAVASNYPVCAIVDNEQGCVSITVVNVAPAAVPDSYEVNSNEVLQVLTPGVLTNDSDLNGDPMTAFVDQQPAHGTLTFNTNGSFTYTPAVLFFGTDTFTYHVSDGKASSPTATVTITVQDTNLHLLMPMIYR